VENPFRYYVAYTVAEDYLSVWARSLICLCKWKESHTVCSFQECHIWGLEYVYLSHSLAMTLLGLNKQNEVRVLHLPVTCTVNFLPG